MKSDDDAIFGGAQVRFRNGAHLPAQFERFDGILSCKDTRAAVTLDNKFFQRNMVAHVPVRGDFGCRGSKRKDCAKKNRNELDHDAMADENTAAHKWQLNYVAN